jgi:hypothetical protein
MNNTHSKLYKHSNKFITSGGYSKFRLPPDQLEFDPEPGIMTAVAHARFGGWETIDSDPYNRLIYYLNSAEGFDMVLTLLTYYDNTADDTLNKGSYEFYIQYSDEYKLTCIAFLVEYNRLKAIYGSDLSRFHSDPYWNVFYDFINKTACDGFLKRKSDDQKWRKEDIVDDYGIKLLKTYAPFVDKDRRSLKPKVKEFISKFDVNYLQKCNIQGGNNRIFSNYHLDGGLNTYDNYINDLSDKDAHDKLYEIMNHLNEHFPDYRNTSSRDYKDLKNYFANDVNGIRDVHDLISCKDFIDFEGTYVIVCIAFDSEYYRLKDSVSDIYLNILKEFIVNTSCVPIIKPKSDDQLWLKETLHRTYGINTMKLYMTFIFRRGIRQDIKELFNNNLRDIEVKCRDEQNGGYYKKYKKYKLKNYFII